VVEDQEEDNENDLIEELAPTLHQKRGGNLTSTMETIFPRRNLSGSGRVLHRGCSCHGIFSSHTNAVNEETPGITDYPPVQVQTPGSRKHDKTKQHDNGILNQTPATSDTGRSLALHARNDEMTIPVTDDTNENLTDDDTDDFEILNGADPILGANFIRGPAFRPDSLEKRGQISNGEEYVTLRLSAHMQVNWVGSMPFKTETCARQNGIPEVPSDGAQGIGFYHGPQTTQLLLGLEVVDVVDEANSLPEGEICPVDTFRCVTIIWVEEIGEDCLLVLGVVRIWI
jgi:hypothetical protein